MKWGDTCGPSWVLRCPGRGSKTHVIVHVFILGTPGLTALLIGRLGVGPLPTESPVTVRRGYRRYGLPIPLSLPMWVCFWSLCPIAHVLSVHPYTGATLHWSPCSEFCLRNWCGSIASQDLEIASWLFLALCLSVWLSESDGLWSVHTHTCAHVE